VNDVDYLHWKRFKEQIEKRKDKEDGKKLKLDGTRRRAVECFASVVTFLK
jgi:hypothetical protein